MELKEISNVKHRAIITDINNGVDMNTITKTHGVSTSNFYWIKRKYQDTVLDRSLIDSMPINITDYSRALIDKSKYVALKMVNTLLHRNYTHASISQLVNSIVNMNTLVRLEQGKSTENIAHVAIHNLNPEQLNLIKDSIMNLKKSMLNNEE